ncbi:MAG: penicillin-binding transpeptidase domain-containing protein [Propionicimonas sp.]|nr:penicillin-binding transpeptidase domain-containing protein [Propionicimonas sp.]
MNRPIRKVAILTIALFTALMLNLSASYLFRSDALNARPENLRVNDARFSADRGPIMVGNAPIAESDPVKDKYKFQRSYPSGELYAPATGFYSYLYGSSELENTFSSQLAGVDDSQFLDRLVHLASGFSPRGATVETTLNAKAQRAAWRGLDGRKGAVVAIDTSTGAIRALVTSPSYDPNVLAVHDTEKTTTAWDKLNADPDHPMANRAAREIYPPGSTFKVVVAAAALAAGMTPSSEIDATPFKLPGSTVVISGNCGGTRITLQQALEVSCNPGFARLGVQLGADALREQAERFGFGSTFLTDIKSAASKFPESPDDAQTGMSAIGEFEVAASPLQMALVAAAVANDGVVMKPYLVQRVVSADLTTVISDTRPSQASNALGASDAAGLRQMMISVVENGTGSRAQVDGITVGGKTGTAHSDNVRRPYAWFIAFAEELDLAVCVFVEDAEIPATDIAGGRLAAPIAKAVIEAMR